MNTLLIVDDETPICHNLKMYFNEKGFNVLTATDGRSGIETCHSTPVDLVILDLRLPDISGLEVLRNIKAEHPEIGVIMITAYGGVETAVNAMQMNADNFILKPIDLTSLHALVEKTLERYRAQEEVLYLKQKISRLEGSTRPDKIQQPQETVHAIRLLAANSSTTVLILGETGTGKGLVANAIHELSDRKGGPFMDINCAGLSSELLESELFGHEKGAFTDAKTFKKGLLEVANKGSIFLDEIGELSPAVQAKLLKVIENKTFRRLGGTTNIRVDVRIMTATNIDLDKAVRDKKFRKDLYFRLNVMPISLLPLRNRRDDILPLASMFLEEFTKILRKDISGFSPEAEAMLLHYSWPGNCRELKNVIERAVLLCDDGIICPPHMPQNLRVKMSPSCACPQGDWALDSVEKSHIEKVLSAFNHNHTKAAEILGIHRSTLIKKLKKYTQQ